MVEINQSDLENFSENFAEIKETDKAGIDVEQYSGKKVEIEKITEHKGIHGYYIKVLTKVLNSDEENKDFEIRASRIFSLNEEKTEDGKAILTWRQKGKLASFLKSKGVVAPKNLIGKEVVLKLTDVNSDGIQYVTF